ncbi:hypothetical protein [Paracoccus aestuariivivens]|uniref:DnaA N-terminal domain-containing protein n=1 Tax=Paracoccus aestuariivivens TaxID=1820333 RepID=A0A6L6J8H0_9RHOB|nr:hypothetical protein [Paracoccus aestuariivivens]MTH76927.1 hypothetical protein [Paracoccus aestuariivivens]
MDLKRFTGPQAGAQKYDLLTALAVAGLNGTAGFQTSMLRLVALITARYNWKADEFSVSQRDLARMWSVDERTVKREIKRLTSASILLQLRPGVRGRVAAYRLNYAELYRLSAPHWSEVGPDFSARMQSGHIEDKPAEDKVVRIDFRAKPEPADQMPFAITLHRLAGTEPELHRSWFSALSFVSFDGTLLCLKASSSFIGQYIAVHHLKPLQDTAQIEFPSLRRVIIVS